MFCYGSSRKRIDCPFQVRTHRCVFFGTAFQGPRVARGGPANLEPNAILKTARERPKSWQCKKTHGRQPGFVSLLTISKPELHTLRRCLENWGHILRRPFYRFPHPPRCISWRGPGTSQPSFATRETGITMPHLEPSSCRRRPQVQEADAALC